MHSESGGYLYTTMDLRDAADHYGRQFEAAGWKEGGRGNDDMVAWSKWTRQDDKGERVDALFLAAKHPGSAAIFLSAQAWRGGGSFDPSLR